MSSLGNTTGEWHYADDPRAPSTVDGHALLFCSQLYYDFAPTRCENTAFAYKRKTDFFLPNTLYKILKVLLIPHSILFISSQSIYFKHYLENSISTYILAL